MNPAHSARPATATRSIGTRHETCLSPRSLKILTLALALPALLPHSGQAAELTSSDLTTGDQFGINVGSYGNMGLVGANYNESGRGSAYLYRDLDTTAGLIIEHAKLTPSGVTGSDNFGRACSLSGTMGIIGSYTHNTLRGKVYLFRNLDTATGTITDSAQLTASDPSTYKMFGVSTQLAETMALIGAPGDQSYRGAAYVFRNLGPDTPSEINQDLKLTASDGVANDYFGFAASLSGNIGLVGASSDDSSRGSAYVFRGLDNGSGTITENIKLTASDGVAQDSFGETVSLSGSIGLVGASGDEAKTGAAYLFRGLDTATGTMTETAKLTASDSAQYEYYGTSVSLSGTNALVGSYRDTEKGTNAGAAYLYRNMDTATGSVTEDVKITATDGAANNSFGGSSSLNGDNFLVGAFGRNSSTGKAYSGSFSSLTILDAGNSDKTISGIDFTSRIDWIIGQTTDANSVALDAGGKANVTASGKKVYIGKDAGSDNNTLYINGTLTATEVLVGATGNSGNALILDPDGIIPAGCHVIVASGSSLGGSGTLGGNLTLSPGGKLELDPTGLEIQGSATLDATFGVDDILGLDGSVTPGTYSLISGSTTDFSAIGLENVGSANAFLIGGGKAAYLETPTQGTLSLTVYAIPIPVISSAASANGKVGTALTYQIAATNTPISFSALSLPPGLSVNTSTGAITGTPTTAGTYGATVRATNNGGTGSATVTFTIAPLPPVVSSAATANGKVGMALTYQITASNLPTSFSALTLPPGLTINTSTGKITGTPTTAGTYNSTVKATNSGGTGSKSVTFTIAPLPPVISSAATANGKVGTAFAYQTTASNSPTSFSALTLPPGLTINTSTGKITGTPTTAGTYTSTINATNSGGTGSKSVTFTILPPSPVISSAATDTGKVGNAFAYQITASNSPTSFSALTLPPGLTLNTTTGKISGTPTKAGTYTTTLTATNAGGSDSNIVTITIAEETTKPILEITKPLSLSATTQNPSFTVEGYATDNISPTRIEYRINPPGADSGFGAFKSIALDGTAKKKTWAHTLLKLTPGVWKIELRARDAAGNASTSTVVTITRK